MARELGSADAFFELVGMLVAGSDVVEFLDHLTRRSVDVLGAEAGLTTVDEHGCLQVMASSAERVHRLERFELESDEGPGLDCYRSGQPLINGWLGEDPGRWPRFNARARALGFQSAHALPLRAANGVTGSLTLFRDDTRPLDEADVVVSQAIADMATIGILQERTRQAREVAERMQAALDSRMVIEQAKGMVAARAGVTVEEAFGLLRGYARNTNTRLHDVAEATVEGRLGMRQLVWPS